MKNSKQKWVLNAVGIAEAAVFLFFAWFSFSGGSAILGIVCLLLAAAAVGFWMHGLQSMRPKAPIDLERTKLETIEDYMKAFQDVQAKGMDALIAQALQDLARLKDKTVSLEKVLNEVFQDSRISYEKFMTGVRQARTAFLENDRQILVRIVLHDPQGDRQAQTEAYIQERMDENRIILDRLDDLAEQVSALKTEDGAVQDAQALEDLDALIAHSHLYRKESVK
jgi:hypothetical protein